MEFLRAVLAKSALFRFKARGFSMQPFIQDMDVITIYPCGSGRPSAGDVIAFCHPETQKLMLHRVIAKLPDGCVTRGDSACEADGPIPFENILGMVKLVERDSRRVRMGLGPERHLIALLSRHGLLLPLVHRAFHVLNPVLARTSK